MSDSGGGGLSEESVFQQDNSTYPFGTHVSVVEIDTETAAVTVLRHIAVDDGNLATYLVPMAVNVPLFEVAHTVTPTPLNEMEVKGIGEAATVGSTPAIQNAVIDALSHLGIEHLDMPFTPGRVWEAIQRHRVP